MKLFEPIQLGAYQLQHRVVHAPLTRLRNTENNVPTDLMVEYHRQRATKGGLIITEGSAISAKVGGFPRTPGLFTKEQLEGWSKVTQEVHEKEGIIFSQLWHGGRAGSSLYLEKGLQLVSSSPIAIQKLNLMTNGPYEVPREATKDDIQDLIQQFVTAAKNAISAGFDGVEIHGANGYLIQQFISTSSNKRTDDYGGSIPNRARFVLEVTEAVVNAIGAGRTGIRFSPWGGEYIDAVDETSYETYSYILEHLNPNLAYVHFIEPRDDVLRETPDLENSLDPFRKIWQGRPFISSGGYSTSPELIATEAENNVDTLIAVGRAYISNPDLVERLKHGWSLNKYKREYFYTSDAVGYTDYPFYNDTVTTADSTEQQEEKAQ
ncbi:12-oxo-phytodienoic acid-like protein [Circinella umbellata]|nr:12-oxo-phytodienoic acid-like protein [Circinella umbellata]